MLSWIVAAASPFEGWEEFEGAIDGPTGGAIYTFADRPALIGLMVVVSALVFIYFIYASFHIKNGHSSAKTPPTLGLLLIAGAASAMASLYEGVSEQRLQRSARQAEVTQVSQRSRALPAALLGMTGIGAATRRPRKRLRNR